MVYLCISHARVAGLGYNVYELAPNMNIITKVMNCINSFYTHIHSSIFSLLLLLVPDILALCLVFGYRVSNQILATDVTMETGGTVVTDVTVVTDGTVVTDATQLQ